MRSEVSISMGAVQAVREVPIRRTPGPRLRSRSRVLAAGAMLRFLGCAAGFLRLRRYLRNGQQLLPLPEEARRTMRRLGVHADLYVSEDVPAR